MKKIYLVFLAAACILSSCEKPNNQSDSKYGTLIVSGVECDNTVISQSKAVTPALDSYVLEVYNSVNDQLVYKTSYAELKQNQNKIKLLGGDYRLEASSIDGDVPAAEFEKPVYVAQKPFTIVPNQDTELGDVVCTLGQVKVTVDYNEEFLNSVTGDGVASVEVTSGAPLEFGLKYDEEEGIVEYNRSAGYFAVKSGNQNTMVVTYKGSVDGKIGKMTKLFTNIKAQEYHKIVFVKTVDPEGNASFQISIEGFIEDVELGNDIFATESIIGDDPDVPAGDGGIKLVSTCSYDISSPVIVPNLPDPFVFTLKALVPEKVKSFRVKIDSDNQDILNSVLTMTGSTTLDLVNPSEGAKMVFTELLPFPYGDKVNGKSEIDFDLSGAQTPILAFPGNHTFVMKVVDEKGHNKEVRVVLVVE